MKSVAQRQAEFKARQAQKGLYRIQIYLKDEIKISLKEISLMTFGVTLPEWPLASTNSE